MSIDYDLLVHRLHKGACAFQSLRAHRRQRAAATDPATAADVRTPTPSTTPPPAADLAVDSRVTGSREPQAFIAMGSRVVPIFGDVNAVLGATAAPVQGASLMGEPPPPPAPPAEDARPAPPPVPAVSASALKLPVPTPPPRLGLVHGGHARPPAPEPAATTRAEPAAASSMGRNTPPEAAVAPPTPEEAAATIAAMFDTFAQQEVARLEKLHADHRAALATLFQEHREELRARSEADASRTTALLREVLAEHRAEQARSAQLHAEHLAQIPQREADSDLRAALLEQAKLQRETNEDTADNIAALTTIVADLGQTVGMLAVAAAQEARQGRLPTRPTFAVPTRVEPRADAPAPAPCIEAAPGAPPTATAPTAPASTTAHTAEPSAAPRAVDTPASSTARVPPAEAPQQRSARLTRATEAAARARVLQFADEDRDDDDLETGIDDDDDPPPRRPLAPITDIDPPNLREHDHG